MMLEHTNSEQSAPNQIGQIPSPPPDLAADSSADILANSHTHALPSPFTYTEPPPILLTQGAEALLYRTHFLSTTQPAALKFRPSKAYRHPTLDARLTKSRVLAEARVLVKLTGVEGFRVPCLLGLEWDVGRTVKVETNGEVPTKVAKGAWILMEWINGQSVKELLREMDAWLKSKPDIQDVERQTLDQEVKFLLRRIGKAVGAMHSKGAVVHGDLTSSNLMVCPRENQYSVSEGTTAQASPDLDGEIVLIDFGLATQSVQDEDRAVDLYVLERAFGSTHPRQENWFDAEVLQHTDGYRGSFKGANVVLKRLEEVRLRGRKRSMIG